MPTSGELFSPNELTADDEISYQNVEQIILTYYIASDDQEDLDENEKNKRGLRILLFILPIDYIPEILNIYRIHDLNEILPEIYDEDTDTLFSKISEDIYKLVYPFQVSNQQLHEYYRKQVDDFIHEIKR